MKIGIIGAGFVGAACATAMIHEKTCRQIVLIDKDARKARGRASDLRHAASRCKSYVKIGAGGYAALAGASVVVVTAGINEKAGKAVDRNDKLGRLRLLPDNALVYKEIIPQIAKVAPRATIVVVTDPPDALADVARRFTKTNPIISTGTYLDTQRFKIQIAERLGCSDKSVEAIVVGEHGKSMVYVWSSARIGTQSVLNAATEQGWNAKEFQAEVEKAVIDANIDIIEGTGASQHGIGEMTNDIVDAILRDERLVQPIGVLHKKYGVTLSLPATIGAAKPWIIDPPLSAGEARLLRKSAKVLRNAQSRLSKSRILGSR